MMKNQTRDLKKCIPKRFVENFKWCAIGTIAFVVFMYVLWTLLHSFDHPLLPIAILYYIVIVGAFTTVMIVSRKLKRGVINFIKRFLIMTVVVPLILLLMVVNLICIIGFPIVVAFASGIAYIVVCPNNGTLEVMLIIMLASGVISLAFALALDDCLKMTKWLSGVSDSIESFIILEDDDSL